MLKEGHFHVEKGHGLLGKLVRSLVIIQQLPFQSRAPPSLLSLLSVTADPYFAIVMQADIVPHISLIAGISISSGL